MRKLLLALSLVSIASALTCYNGMKLLRMQGVGTTTTECSSGSYCYNMTASAYLMVDFVKAGCSTYRCMLAPNQCISTYFQLIPVSMCCCNYDRCNVGGNPVYSDNPQSITGGGSGDNYNYGGGENNNNNNNNNNKNQGGSGYDYNYGNGGNTNNNNNNNQNSGASSWGSGYNYGSNSGSNTPTAQAGRKFTPKEIEDRFRDYDVDHRGGNNGGGGVDEESFQKVDAFTTPRPGSGGRSGGSLPRQGSTTSRGGEIEILGDTADNSGGSSFNGDRRDYSKHSRRDSDYNNENQPGSAWGGSYDRQFRPVDPLSSPNWRATVRQPIRQQPSENEETRERTPHTDESQPGSAWGSEYDQKFGSTNSNPTRNDDRHTGGYSDNNRKSEDEDGRIGSAWGSAYDSNSRQNNVNPTVGRYNSRDYNSERREQGPVNDNGQGYRDNPRNNDEGREIESR